MIDVLDLLQFAPSFYHIADKSGRLVPFKLNRAQLYIHQRLEEQRKATGMVRALILKGRQQGCSTYVQSRFLHQVLTKPGTQAFILTHHSDATRNLFDITKRYYKNLPDGLAPKATQDSHNRLTFGKPLESGYRVGTAGSGDVGRSQTNQLLHLSEYAFYQNTADIKKGLENTVADIEGTEKIKESTANGVTNDFYRDWQAAKSGQSHWQAIFVPWFWQDEYTANDDGFVPTLEEQTWLQLYGANGLTTKHLAWRRIKLSDMDGDDDQKARSFSQEYPCIVGDQRVGTDSGILPICEVKAGMSANTGCIKKAWMSGYKQTIELQTYMGYTLKCTLDHRISTNNNFVEASKSINSFIDLSIPNFSKKQHTVKLKTFPCLDLKIQITEELGLFLGYFMGDGSYSGNVLSFAFTKNDINSIKKVRNLTHKLFGLQLIERKISNNGTELRCGSINLKEIFLQLGIIEIVDHTKKNYTKRKVCVPDCIWKSPKNVIKSFLSGLFDADGFVGKKYPTVKFFSKYECFAKDIQLLLLGFGITCKRTHAQKIAGNDKHTYTGNELALRKNEAIKFMDEIGFISYRKQSRVNTWNTQENVGRKANNIEFKDKVVQIKENGMQYVYDLTIDNENHVFDAQGILVHNCTDDDAFLNSITDSFINKQAVERARANTVETDAGLVIGVDPARSGTDRSAIIRRRGRKAFDLQTWQGIDTMELAGKVKMIIDKESPQKVFIDSIGIGAGVVDRLHEMGYQHVVVGVNVAKKPRDTERYANTRAEIWATMRDWFLNDLGVDIPDSEDLQSDLCGLSYKYKSTGQLLIESKEDAKKRNIRSPDCADSLALTFSFGAQITQNQIPVNTAPVAARTGFT
jgi:intein/homing endonuclease